MVSQRFLLVRPGGNVRLQLRVAVPVSSLDCSYRIHPIKICELLVLKTVCPLPFASRIAESSFICTRVLSVQVNLRLSLGSWFKTTHAITNSHKTGDVTGHIGRLIVVLAR